MLSLRDQIEGSDARVLDVRLCPLVTNGKGVCRIQLVIHARINNDPALRHAKYLRERVEDRQRLRV